MHYLQHKSIQAWVITQQRWTEAKENAASERGASVVELIIIGVGLVAVGLLVVNQFRSKASSGIDCLDLTGSIPEGCVTGTVDLDPVDG